VTWGRGDVRITFSRSGVGDDRDVWVRPNRPGATVGDLAAALSPNRSAPHLLIDGRRVANRVSLEDSGLHEGSVVGLDPTDADDGADAADITLLVASGLTAGDPIRLRRGRRFVIGRDAAADVRLRSATISRLHAVLSVDMAGSVAIEDLGSVNGTLVDGRPIDSPVGLRPGSVVEVGEIELALGDPVGGGDTGGRAGEGRWRPPGPRPGPPGRWVVDRPDPPSPETLPPLRIAILPLLVPVLAGAVLAVLTARTWLLWFFLLTPLMGLIQLRAAASARQARRRVDDQACAAEAADRNLLEEAFPDAIEVVRRATTLTDRLWERRPSDDDFLVLRLGTRPAPSRLPTMPGVPITVPLARYSVTSIGGRRLPKLAVARSMLVQAAVHHRPSDLAIVVLCGAEAVADWDWTKWLPHTVDPADANERFLATGPELFESVLSSALDARREGSAGHVLVLVDNEELLARRRSSIHRWFSDPPDGVSFVVVDGPTDRADARIDVSDDDLHADVAFVRPEAARVPSVRIAGMSEPLARRCARALAPVVDLDRAPLSEPLPDQVPLLSLLHLSRLGAASISERWAASHGTALPAPIGVSASGIFDLDLVDQGPHALVGGTTGSGKSELLRTIAASLAASYDPAHLSLLLIDYKGGSAFGACARLPHTVGVVTGLDDLGRQRLLLSLEAELDRRVLHLRQHEASDLATYLRHGAPGGPLPRLVIVVDELASLLAEIPEMVEQLIAIARRGRGLGIHLVLSTQRPAGIISGAIAANVSLRIALRVNTAAESNDVLGAPDAAAIPQAVPGRALVRAGDGSPTVIQAAITRRRSDRSGLAPVEVEPFAFGPRLSTQMAADRTEVDELEDLVDLIGAAFEQSGHPRPRPPMLPPLPLDLAIEDVEASAGSVVLTVGLVDDPATQTQLPGGWDLTEGNIVVAGRRGTGRTSALAALGLAVGRQLQPDDAHLYVIDSPAGDLAPLAGLPHTGAVIDARDHERQARLLRFLDDELDRRLLMGGASDDFVAAPRIVVLIDSLERLVDALSSGPGMPPSSLERLADLGPSVGILVAAGCTSAVGGRAMVRRAASTWALSMPDEEWLGFGLPRRLASPRPPGRVVLPNLLELHIARSRASLDSAVSALAALGWAAPARRPVPIPSLPAAIGVDKLGATGQLGADGWSLPVGVGETSLEARSLVLGPESLALITGPPRSGKTSALLTLAHVARRTDGPVGVVGVARPGSTLAASPDLDVLGDPDDLTSLLVGLRDLGDRATLVLVDDAETIADPAGVLEALARSGARWHPVVALDIGASSSLQHWTRWTWRGEPQLVLQPSGDRRERELSRLLPGPSPVRHVPGRGYLVTGGRLEIVQVALTGGPS
jgi:S-DNA-T family DNA segregation ATPase FtsK/SpoIIIE